MIPPHDQLFFANYIFFPRAQAAEQRDQQDEEDRRRDAATSRPLPAAPAGSSSSSYQPLREPPSSSNYEDPIDDTGEYEDLTDEGQIQADYDAQQRNSARLSDK